jgi:hypothetical protein
MTRKALWLLPASVVAVVASQWRDIVRYVKIQQMSRGGPDRDTGSGSDASSGSEASSGSDTGSGGAG